MKPIFRNFLLASMLTATAAHADTRTWDGSSSADWNTNDNWDSGVPVAADDVVFDGTGTNLNISLSASGPLKSLTFTAGQTAAVNINTVAGTQNIIPSNSTGSLTVAAGSGNHKITGTGTSASALNRDFAILSSLTGFTFDIGSGSSFEINGRVGGGTTSATYAKNGGGTLILSGQNGGSSAWQFTGASGMFTVNQGVVRFANAAAFGNSGNKYTVTAGAAIELSGGFSQTVNVGTITLNGTGIGSNGALRSLSGNNTITGAQVSGVGGIVLAADSSIGVDADALTINQVVSGGFSVTKVGAGTLTLGGANTYSGGTIVSAGTLSLGASNVLANSAPVSLAGTTTLSVGAGFTDTVGSLDVTGAATISLGSSTSGLAFSNSSSVDWTGGTLNIIGTLTGTSIRFGTNSGGLTSGQLALISVNGSGAGTYILDGSGYLASNRTWDGSDSSDWGTGNNWSGDTMPGDTELATFTSASPSGFDLYLGSANRLIKGITLDATTGSNPYTINLQETSIITTSRTLTVGTGGITANAGAHTIKGAKLGGGNNGPLVLTGAPFNIATGSTLTFDVRLKQSATGQSYSKTGAGTLVLNADNGGGQGWIHSGFTVSQGVLRLAAANAFGNSANSYTVSSGAALDITGGFNQTNSTGTINLNSTGIGNTGALRSISGTNAINGAGSIDLDTDSSIGVDADSLSIANVISGGFNLTKVGSGTLTLSNTSTYGGTTSISSGTLSLSHATNTLPDATAVTLGAATLSIGAGRADTVGSLDVTGAATINLGDATSALVFTGATGTWAGTLNLTGTFVPGASIKFGVGALSVAQLASISATGWSSFALDGSGFLTATATGGFSSWITGTFANGPVAGGEQGPHHDADDDGVSNLVEYAIAGQDPTVPNPTIGTFTANTLSFTKRASTSGLTYAIQESTDLGITDDWTEVSGGSYVNNATTISYTLTPPTPAKNFTRLKVTSL